MTGARDAGIGRDRIWIDPGIGFGKRREDNLALLATSDASAARRAAPRRRLAQRFLALDVDAGPDDRLAASLRPRRLAAASGAAIVRVHDVAATRRAVALAGRPRDGELARLSMYLFNDFRWQDVLDILIVGSSSTGCLL
jgi:dihydropteroate synthase